MLNMASFPTGQSNLNSARGGATGDSAGGGGNTVEGEGEGEGDGMDLGHGHAVPHEALTDEFSMFGDGFSRMVDMDGQWFDIFS